MGKLIEKSLDATTSAISWDIEEIYFGDEDFDIKRIVLAFETQPVSAGLVTLVYNATGKIIRSVNPVGEDSIAFENVNNIPQGSKCTVTYANPDKVSITGDVSILIRRYE